MVAWVVLPRVLKVNPWTSLRSLDESLVVLAVLGHRGTQWTRRLLVRRVTAGDGPVLQTGRTMMPVLGVSRVGLLGGGIPVYAAVRYRWMRAEGISPVAALMAGWSLSLLLSSAVAVIAAAWLSVRVVLAWPSSPSYTRPSLTGATNPMCAAEHPATAVVAVWLFHPIECLNRSWYK